MYNDKVKTEYIELMKRNGKTVEESLTQKFNKVASYEERLGKDLCNFSLKEIIGYYKSLYSNSITTLNAINTYYSRYTAWCLSKGLVEDDQNHYNEATSQILATCLNNTRMEDSMMTREELLDFINDLQNPSDQFLLLGLFEGLTIEDMYYLQKDDIKNNCFKLHSGREFIVSSKLIELARDSMEEYSRYDLDGNKDSLHQYDPSDTRPIKRRSGTVNDDLKSFNRSIATRLRYIQKNYGMDFSRAAITEAGRIDYIVRMKKEDGEDFEALIETNRSNIEGRYGMFYSVPRWLEQYGKYLSKESEV